MSDDDPTRQRPFDSGGSDDWLPAGGAPDAVTAELGEPEKELSRAERKAREKAEKEAAKAREKAEKEQAKRAKEEEKRRRKAAKEGDEAAEAETAAEKEQTRASERAAELQETGAQEAEEAREQAEREAREKRERADEEARRALEAGDAAAKRMREEAREPVVEPTPVVSGSVLTSPGVGAETPPRAQAAAAEGASAAGETRPQDRVEPLAPGERPEVLVGAAFAGAFVFAKLLKRISNR